MKKLKISVAICVLVVMQISVFAQDEWKTIAHPMGFSMEVPENIKVEEGDAFFSCQGWFKAREVASFGIGVITKTFFRAYEYNYKSNPDEKFELLRADQNAELVSRKGFPACFFVTRNERTSSMELFVEFDQDNILHFSIHTWDKDKWPLLEEELKRMVASIRISKVQNYTASPEDEKFLDPPILTNEAVAATKGSLNGKISHFSYQLSTPLDWDKLSRYPIEIAALPDGGFVMAWVDTSYHTHLQSFDKKMKVRGPEKIIKNAALIGLTGDNKGFAGIFLRKKYEVNYGDAFAETFIIGYTSDLEFRFKTFIVGDPDMKEVDDQRVDVDDGHNRIAYGNGVFAVYLSTYRHWKDGMTHQGDFLRFYDQNGKIVKRGNFSLGWTWGVSHSFSKAICHDGTDFNMITCGDGYPRGLAYSRMILEKREGDYGVSQKDVMHIEGELGNNNAKVNDIGAIQANQKWAFVLYKTPTHGLKYPGTEFTYPKLHLLRVSKDGKGGRPQLLFANAKKTETGLKSVPYGKGFLVIFSEYNASGLDQWEAWKDRYQLLDAEGRKVGAVYDLPTWFVNEIPKCYGKLKYSQNRWGGSKAIATPKGEVIWVRQLPIDDRVEIVRIGK